MTVQAVTCICGINSTSNMGVLKKGHINKNIFTIMSEIGEQPLGVVRPFFPYLFNEMSELPS